MVLLSFDEQVTENEKLPVFDCVAQVTSFIESKNPKELFPSVIGRWSSGEEIKITGKRRCVTVLGTFWAVRWTSPVKGLITLWSKGLAFYNYSENDFPGLPIVK